MKETQLICILLWLFFGLQHSMLARPHFKSIIKHHIGNNFETHFYPIIYFISQCIIFYIIYDLIRNLEPQHTFLILSDDSKLIIYILNRLANLFLILTVFHFDIGRFTGVTQLIEFFTKNQSEYAPLKLNEYWLYKYIRHPMYLGILMVYLTSTTVYTDIFLLNTICIFIYIEIGSYFEEKSLINRFGSTYIDYSKRTFKFLPFIR